MLDFITSGHGLLIAGMAAATYIPRVVPLLALSSRSLNPALMRWLNMIPPAILAALLAPCLLVQKDASGAESLFISADNVFLLAAIPAFATAALTKSFLGTTLVGIGGVALLRALL